MIHLAAFTKKLNLLFDLLLFPNEL